MSSFSGPPVLTRPECFPSVGQNGFRVFYTLLQEMFFRQSRHFFYTKTSFSYILYFQNTLFSALLEKRLLDLYTHGLEEKERKSVLFPGKQKEKTLSKRSKGKPNWR